MYSDDQKLGCLIYKVSVSASQIAGTGDVLRWHATRNQSSLIGALPSWWVNREQVSVTVVALNFAGWETTTTQTVKVREGSNKCDV